jgi:NAD/NADP transhydrogenase alpha subunit
MKLDTTSQTTTPTTRRGLVIGAGVAGAAALAVKVMPGQAVATTAVAAAAKRAVDTAGGYQLTQHVLRYYETTRA